VDGTGMTNPWLWGGLAAIFGFGAVTLKNFEHSAAHEIGEKLVGDHKSVSIGVTYPGLLSPAIGEIGTATIRAAHFRCEGLPLFTEPKRSKKGTIDNLRLDLSDFYLRDLRCERFMADIPNCRFDFALAATQRKVRLSKSGLGAGSVELKVVDLGPYILKKDRDIKTVEVTTEGDWIRVKGFGLFLVLNADFDVKAKITTNGSQLLLSDCIIRIDNKETDLESQQALINALNPVIDFAKDLDLYDAVDAKTVQIIGNTIKVTGRVKIPDLPE
jgi:hypothetical protein